MNVSNLGFGNLDINSLANHINNINPEQLLAKFGYKDKEADAILHGDLSPIIQKENKQPILDYVTIIQYYGKQFNQNLISLFFKKAKNKEAFSQEEINAYNSAYNNWFSLIFKIGSNFIYCADETINDKSLIIRIYEDYYQMSIIDNINAIIYLKDFVY